MAACSMCGTAISTAEITQGKYRKQDGQILCLKCDGVSVPRPGASANVISKPAGSAIGAKMGSTQKPTVTSRSASTGAPKAARPAGGHAPRYSPQQEGMDPTTKIALMVAGGILLVAAIVMIVIMMKHKATADLAKEAKERSVAALQDAQKFYEENPEAYEEAIQRIDKHLQAKSVLEDSVEMKDITTLRSRIASNQQQAEFRKKNIDLFAELQKQADDLSKIDDSVNKANILSGAAVGMEDEFQKKVLELSFKVHTNMVKAAQASIRDYEAKNPKDLKGILDRYRLAFIKLEEMAKQGGEVGKLAFQTKKELRQEEDLKAEAYYNEIKDRTNAVSLLDANNRGKWIKSGPVEITFNGEDMVVKSTVGAGAKERGTILSGKKDFWIDFDADVEVEVIKGGFVIVGRYSSSQNFFQLSFETGGEGNPIVEGKTYTFHVNAVGRTVFFNVDGVELSTNKFEMPAAARSGALGFAIVPGGEVVFKKIRAKIYRSDVQ